MDYTIKETTSFYWLLELLELLSRNFWNLHSRLIHDLAEHYLVIGIVQSKWHEVMILVYLESSVDVCVDLTIINMQTATYDIY